jgi:hypothetical protein
MAKTFMTPEEGAEYERPMKEYLKATHRAMNALAARDLSGFEKADGEAGVIVRRIKEILGTTGQRWMA